METYKLVRVDSDGTTVLDDFELTKWEYTNALTTHKRMQQRKER